MPKTRLSLYYVATYLLFLGFGMLLTPRLTMTLLFTNTEYDSIILRVVGMLLIGLGFFMVQFIRLQVTMFYPSTILVGSVFSVCLVAFYLMTLNLFFLLLLIIVLVGVIITSMSLLSDRKGREA